MSASHSDSRSTTQQNYSDERIGVADQGTAIVTREGSIAITDASPDVIESIRQIGLGAFDLADKSQQHLASLIDAQAERSNANDLANSQLLDSALSAQAAQLAALTELGKTTATGGQSDFNRTLLYLGLGLFGVMAVFFFARR